MLRAAALPLPELLLLLLLPSSAAPEAEEAEPAGLGEEEGELRGLLTEEALSSAMAASGLGSASASAAPSAASAAAAAAAAAALQQGHRSLSGSSMQL